MSETIASVETGESAARCSLDQVVGHRESEPHSARTLAWLKGRVKELENTVARLERDSHAPVDLRPAIIAIIHEILRDSKGGAQGSNGGDMTRIPAQPTRKEKP